MTEQQFPPIPVSNGENAEQNDVPVTPVAPTMEPVAQPDAPAPAAPVPAAPVNQPPPLYVPPADTQVIPTAPGINPALADTAVLPTNQPLPYQMAQVNPAQPAQPVPTPQQQQYPNQPPAPYQPAQPIQPEQMAYQPGQSVPPAQPGQAYPPYQAASGAVGQMPYQPAPGYPGGQPPAGGEPPVGVPGNAPKPPMRKSRKIMLFSGIAVLILALIGGGAALWLFSRTGAATPEAAVTGFFDDGLTKGDLLELGKNTSPSEIEMFVQSMSQVYDTMPEGSALNDQQTAAFESMFKALNLELSGLKTETKSIDSNTSLVTVKAGKLTVAPDMKAFKQSLIELIDASDAPKDAADEAKQQIDSLPLGDPGTETLDFADIDDPLLFITVKEDNLWYVSPTLTVLENAVRPASHPAVPQGTGKANAEAAVNDLLGVIENMAVNDLDSAGFKAEKKKLISKLPLLERRIATWYVPADIEDELLPGLGDTGQSDSDSWLDMDSEDYFADPNDTEGDNADYPPLDDPADDMDNPADDMDNPADDMEDPADDMEEPYQDYYDDYEDPVLSAIKLVTGGSTVEGNVATVGIKQLRVEFDGGENYFEVSFPGKTCVQAKLTEDGEETDEKLCLEDLPELADYNLKGIELVPHLKVIQEDGKWYASPTMSTLSVLADFIAQVQIFDKNNPGELQSLLDEANKDLGDSLLYGPSSDLLSDFGLVSYGHSPRNADHPKDLAA